MLSGKNGIICFRSQLNVSSQLPFASEKKWLCHSMSSGENIFHLPIDSFQLKRASNIYGQNKIGIKLLTSIEQKYPWHVP